MLRLARFALQMLIVLPILFGITFAIVSLSGNESASAQTQSTAQSDRFIYERADQPASSQRRPAPTVPRAPVAAQKAEAAPPARNSEFQPTTVRTLPAPLETGEYIWDDSRAPDAPLRLVVDIDSEEIYAYRGGYEIGRSTIVYGADHKPTPLGTFTILEKDIDHVSNLYDAPMPYMLRLTWDGIAVHASDVDNRFATHGCVGVPDGFAAKIYAIAKLGDTVTVTRGWTSRWG